MDKAARVFAAPLQFTLGGKQVQINPRLVRHYAEIEQHLLATKPNPFQLAKANAELFADQPEMQRELMRLAMSEGLKSNYVTRQELHDWISTTIAGHCFVTWLAVRDTDRQLYTLEYVTQLLIDEMDDLAATQGAAAAEKRKLAIQDAINQASGSDELGNSIGSAQ